MENNKKQTAVDFLFEKLFENFEKLQKEEISFKEFFELNMKHRDEAKQIEHEQMREFIMVIDLLYKYDNEKTKKELIDKNKKWYKELMENKQETNDDINQRTTKTKPISAIKRDN